MFNPEVCIIRSVCPCCGELNHIHALQSEFDAWEAGARVQDAFPTMSATDRESLISGLCPDCQAIFFSGYDDEEVDD
jgi:hypothetical protein